ncbi:MAG: hypothetical protein ACR2PR_05060 [Pseudohongiellaceae bacterium]
MDWNTWWIWIGGGILLIILEIFVPAFWFLGFAIGALIIGLLLAIFGPFTSPAVTVLLFSMLSLIAWLVIRRVVGVRKGQLHVTETDVNED